MTTFQENIGGQEFGKADLTKIAALQQKRTLAFVNHFVMTNVQFLNSFMKQCEQKLMQFERKLEKVNASMVLLEARLSSIPELNTTTIPTATQLTENIETEIQDTSQIVKVDTVREIKPDTNESIEVTPQMRPEYEKFVKMVQVGVPVQAVKLKLSLEGLDPLVLDEILTK